MVSSRIKKATRQQSKLRMAIDGPSGSGKTYTALRFAFAIGPKVLVIDSEHGSASKYVNEIPEDDGAKPWEFDTIKLTTFSPSEYQAAVEEAGAGGYDVIVIDSLSHAWEGKDGALELKDRAGGNSFTAWKDITPMHRRMVEAILASPSHVIVTMRSKTEYVIETDGNGKSVPRRVGMAPVQRQGMEYEFDVYGSLDWSHILTISKTRCRALDGKIAAKPGASFVKPIMDWLNTGTASEPASAPTVKRLSDDQMMAIVTAVAGLGWSMEQLATTLPSRYQTTDVALLSPDNADDLVKWLAGQQRIQDATAARERKAAENKAKANGEKGAELPKPETASEAKPDDPATDEHFLNGNGNGNGKNGQQMKVGFNASPEPGQISSDQADAIKARVKRLIELGMPREAYKDKILKKRGVETARDLTRDQAAELIDALSGKIKDLEAKQGIKHPDELPAADAGK